MSTITKIPAKPLSLAETLYLQGCHYFMGDKVEQSYNNAIRCFTKAAELNHPLAQYCLGCMYLDGMGVEQDCTRGTEWLRKSAELGCVEAKKRLGYQ